MRRTLASPILAISSNKPSAIFADALSASIRTARRGERISEGMTSPIVESEDIVLRTAPWTAMDGYSDVGALAARPNFLWRAMTDRRLCEKAGRSLNQPVGRHDAYGVDDRHIEPVKCPLQGRRLQ